MKKKVANYLRNTAASLPTVYELQKTRVAGADILKENPKAKTGDGKPISPKYWYFIDLPKPVHHENRLKQLWENTPKDKRQQAVLDYCSSAHALYESQMQKAEKKVEEEIQHV